jgi:hypothetical protein
MFYGLGAVGFTAITVLPVRFWVLMRRLAWFLRSGTGPRAAYLLLAMTGIAALFLAGASLVHVSRCLLGLHCGAKAAGGWMALGGVGFWYLAFELVAFIMIRLALRRLGSQPNNSFKPTPRRGVGHVPALR